MLPSSTMATNTIKVHGDPRSFPVVIGRDDLTGDLIEEVVGAGRLHRQHCKRGTNSFLRYKFTNSHLHAIFSLRHIHMLVTNVRWQGLLSVIDKQSPSGVNIPETSRLILHTKPGHRFLTTRPYFFLSFFFFCKSVLVLHTIGI